MKNRVFKDANNDPINPQLEDLESIKQKVDDIIAKKDVIIQSIRQSFVDEVVIFIDLVGSTKFKVKNVDEAEKWISRIKHFGDIIREYIEQSNGKVVKYIGDEVMGIFERDTQIDDALGLILRINDIEDNLTKITGTKTQVKIALDYGKVVLIKYDGHDELDPQGTPIDRCARISKHCQPSTILSSFEFVSKCNFPKQWFKLGIVDMKGLGQLPIYQYGNETIELQNKIEIKEQDLNDLKELNNSLSSENQNLKLSKNELVSTINELQKQIKTIGEKPIIDTDFSEKSKEEQKEKDWDQINISIALIKKIIKDADVHEYYYARFIFLFQKELDEEYNVYKDKVFDDLIEKNLVVLNSNDRYEINYSNKRNHKIINLINKTETLINEYLQKYGNINNTDLFEYSFSDADFWNNYLDYNVIF